MIRTRTVFWVCGGVATLLAAYGSVMAGQAWGAALALLCSFFWLRKKNGEMVRSLLLVCHVFIATVMIFSGRPFLVPCMTVVAALASYDLHMLLVEDRDLTILRAGALGGSLLFGFLLAVSSSQLHVGLSVFTTVFVVAGSLLVLRFAMRSSG